MAMRGGYGKARGGWRLARRHRPVRLVVRRGSARFALTCASNHCVQAQNVPPSGAAMTSDNGVGRIAREDGVSPMKTILSALIALSVLAGFAGNAAANVDAKSFYEQVDRDRF